MKTKDIIKELNEKGFEISSSFKNGFYTVKADNESILYIRNGRDFGQCVKSLKFDIK